MVTSLRSAVGIAAICLTAAGLSATAWFAIDSAGRDDTGASMSTLHLPPPTTPTPGSLPATTRPAARLSATPAPLSATPTPSAASQPAAAPIPPTRTIAVDGDASAASSAGMLNRGIYGTGIGYDTKANLWIGGPHGQKVAIRFKATTTSALKSVRFVQRGGAGYSLGTGGTMTISVRADDGTGRPSATSLAQQSYTPGNPGRHWEKFDPVAFSSPPTLTAGTIYYIVFTNAGTSDYISVNSVYAYNATSPRQPMFSDSEYGLMHTSGTWGALTRGYTPVVDLAYANGTHDGQSYYEAMIDRYATISGASNMARERFSVSGGSRTVESASLRLRRSGGTSPLRMTLETSAGVAIESVTVPAAKIPVSAPGGDNGGAVWVTARFSSPRVLTNGSSYNLRISTESGTTYTTFPIRAGTDKGINTYAFSGGTGQFTTNGSRWTDLHHSRHRNLQFYFTLAPAPTKTTKPTTTPAPTTTTTTPAPTTTAPPPATSLQCPVTTLALPPFREQGLCGFLAVRP